MRAPLLLPLLLIACAPEYGLTDLCVAVDDLAICAVEVDHNTAARSCADLGGELQQQPVDHDDARATGALVFDLAGGRAWVGWPDFPGDWTCSTQDSHGATTPRDCSDRYGYACTLPDNGG